MAYLLKGGPIIDGTGAAPIADGAVRVEGDKIAAVGPADEVGSSGDVEVSRK